MKKLFLLVAFVATLSMPVRAQDVIVDFSSLPQRERRMYETMAEKPHLSETITVISPRDTVRVHRMYPVYLPKASVYGALAYGQKKVSGGGGLSFSIEGKRGEAFAEATLLSGGKGSFMAGVSAYLGPEKGHRIDRFFIGLGGGLRTYRNKANVSAPGLKHSRDDVNASFAGDVRFGYLHAMPKKHCELGSSLHLLAWGEKNDDTVVVNGVSSAAGKNSLKLEVSLRFTISWTLGKVVTITDRSK